MKCIEKQDQNQRFIFLVSYLLWLPSGTCVKLSFKFNNATRSPSRVLQLEKRSNFLRYGFADSGLRYVLHKCQYGGSIKINTSIMARAILTLSSYCGLILPDVSKNMVCELPFYEICQTNVSRIECTELGCCYHKETCYKKAVPRYMKAFVALIVIILAVFTLFMLKSCLGGKENLAAQKKENKEDKESIADTDSTSEPEEEEDEED